MVDSAKGKKKMSQSDGSRGRAPSLASQACADDNQSTVTVTSGPTERAVSVMARNRRKEKVEIMLTDHQVIGEGTFGVVKRATLADGSFVAIKQVHQDRRYKNRELQTMLEVDHDNVVKLLYYYYSEHKKRKGNIFLNVVMEFIPDNLYNIERRHAKSRTPLSLIRIKVYMYQIFRGLAYLHSIGICHRDLKPHNILVNVETAITKVCDLGSAKRLEAGKPSVAYICSRYYRAPELLFGATDYTTKIDNWAAGCVLAELFNLFPIFPGSNTVDQLARIIKILGTPSVEQVSAWRSTQSSEASQQDVDLHAIFDSLPVLQSRTWESMLPSATPKDGIALLENLIEYNPNGRLTMAQACAHPFFDELREYQPSPEAPASEASPITAIPTSC